MTDTVTSAVEERLEGGRPGRMKAVVAAVVIGIVALVAAYRLLRSGSGGDTDPSREES